MAVAEGLVVEWIPDLKVMAMRTMMRTHYLCCTLQGMAVMEVQDAQALKVLTQMLKICQIRLVFPWMQAAGWKPKE